MTINHCTIIMRQNTSYLKFSVYCTLSSVNLSLTSCRQLWLFWTITYMYVYYVYIHIQDLISEPQLQWLLTALYHTSLHVKIKVTHAHDTFLQILSFIGSAELTRSEHITCHAHMTLMTGLRDAHTYKLSYSPVETQREDVHACSVHTCSIC